MKRMIKPLWVALATLSALLSVVSCVKDLAVKEQEVSFDSSLTTEQSQIVKGDSTVTATPADGWEVKIITANGKDITTDKSFVVTEDTVVKVTFKAVEVVVPLPADPQGPPLWLLVKYIFVDESGSDLPIPFSQYWQYVSVESYPLLNLTIDVNKPQSFDIPEGYERISWYGDFGENVVVRCVENEGFDSKFGPFWRISLKKPLSDYDLTGITVNSVSENHVTRRPIPLTSSSGNSSLIQTFPKLADSYDLTGSPTFRAASPRKTRNYPYLEIKYHFKRK